MIKKASVFIICTLLLTMLLNACSQVSRTQTSATGQVSDPAMGNGQALPGQAGQNMSMAMKLALGTLLLEKNGVAISADQAAELLFLWKAARSLGESETTAEAEMQALIIQIQNTYTAEQQAAFDSMQLSGPALGEVFKELGLEVRQGGGFGNMSPEMRATMQAARASGQSPTGRGGGGPPMDFAGGGGPGGFSPEARQTASARFSSFQRTSLGVNSEILDALIEYLQNKAG